MPNFTPSQDKFAPGKEREWAGDLGLLDWDDTSIVFTKRSLLEFLRYTGVTVDTMNWSNVKSLPRYATFGKMDGDGAAPASSSVPASSAAAPTAPAQHAGGFRPTRRVREAPGGTQSISLFGDDFEDNTPFPAPAATSPSLATVTTSEPPTSDGFETQVSSLSVKDNEEPSRAGPARPVVLTADGEVFRPTRRVRENPGGKDSIHAMFSELEESEQQADSFKPTRRVRENPGGQSSGLW